MVERVVRLDVTVRVPNAPVDEKTDDLIRNDVQDALDDYFTAGVSDVDVKLTDR